MADQIFMPRATDANDDPVSGAEAYFYRTGTSTPQTVYADSGLSTAHPSPLLADANGTFAQVYVAAATLVKVDVQDPDTNASLPGYPYDPAFLWSTDSSAASSVTFSPISGNAATDVQAAIKNNTDGKQNLDAELTALAGLTSAANKVPYFTGSEAAGLLDFLDEDDMASDSATGVPSQQSTKAYVDASAVGVGKTWQDVSASRTNATSYQNTTGGPITLAIAYYGSEQGVFVSSDGSTWLLFSQLNASATITLAHTVTTIVPNNWYYKVDNTPSGTTVGTLHIWLELR